MIRTMEARIMNDEDKESRIIRVPAEIGAQYSLFSTEDGETYSGGGSYMIEEFATFMGQCIKEALVELLNDNPNKILSLVIVSEKMEFDETEIKEFGKAFLENVDKELGLDESDYYTSSLTTKMEEEP